MVEDLSHSQTQRSDLDAQKRHSRVTILCTVLRHDQLKLPKSFGTWVQHTEAPLKPRVFGRKSEILNNLTGPCPARFIRETLPRYDFAHSLER